MSHGMGAGVLALLGLLVLPGCGQEPPPVMELEPELVQLAAGLPQRVVDPSGSIFLLVPGGSFDQGIDLDYGDGVGMHDGPRHRTTLSPYYLARDEVTIAQYRRFLEANPAARVPDEVADPGPYVTDDSFPVWSLSWAEAVAYTQWLSAEHGIVYRLPTEAEWEYAARAGVDAYYWWGNRFRPTAFPARLREPNYQAYPRSYPGGVYGANPWGFHQFYGSAAEWCLDWFGDYSAAPQRDPVGPSHGSRRIQRGGSWAWEASAIHNFFRMSVPPEERSGGIRLAIPIRSGFTLTVLEPHQEAEVSATSAVSDVTVPRRVLPLGDGVELAFRWCPPGSYRMGAEDWVVGASWQERPVTEVRLERGFWLAETETTRAQWTAMGGESSKADGSRAGNEPITMIARSSAYRLLEKATAFHRARNDLAADETLRLPNEWEWEYAARAGRRERLDHAALAAEAVVGLAALDGPLPVATRQPNSWGLYDMIGNVAEWCTNARFTYPGGTVSSGTFRVLGQGLVRPVRGGCYHTGRGAVRPSLRLFFNDGDRGQYPWIGFRIVLDAPAPSE